MRPRLLRPAGRFWPRVSAFTGFPLCRPARSTSTNWRWPGVTGLYVFSAIAMSSQARRHVDLVTLDQGHDRLLHVALVIAPAAPCFELAGGIDRIHRFDLDLEQLFDSLFDLRLGCVERDLEDHLIGFREPCRF